MQRLIVITGDLAAGKSTLAMALSEHYQIPFITALKPAQLIRSEHFCRCSVHFQEGSDNTGSCSSR